MRDTSMRIGLRLGAMLAVVLAFACQRTPEELTADLIGAAESGDATTAVKALERGADPNRKDGSGQTPLFVASCKGHAEVVEVLLEAGADPNLRAVASDNGFTRMSMSPLLCTGRALQLLSLRDLQAERDLIEQEAADLHKVRSLLEESGAGY